MRKIALLICVLFALCSFPFALNGCNSNQKLTEYKIDCTFSDNTLTGKQIVSFYNNTDIVFNELKFNLFGNAFREGAVYSPIADQHKTNSYPNGTSYGDMQISHVEVEGDDKDILVQGQDQNILVVELDREVFPNERVEVYIEYTLNLANVVARTGYNDHTVNLANFYPILCGIDQNGFYECVYYSIGDPYYSDTASYKVTFCCDNTYIVASSGIQVAKNNDNGLSIYEFQLDCARDFALVLSKDFNILQDDSTDVQVNYYYYQDKEPNKSMDFCVKAINLFAEKFGQFPYQSLAVVQTEFVQGGMEFPALVMISDDLEGVSYGEVIVHETAHQWWQSAVGCNEIEHGFLDEGLAEYSVVLFYENYSEYGYTRENLIKSSQDTYKVFCSVYDKVFKGVNTVMDRSLKDFINEYEYVNIAYIKPCIMFDELRKTIGEQKFFTALQRYYKEYKFKNATPDDMVGAFEKCGADTNGYFESFFNGKAII